MEMVFDHPQTEARDMVTEMELPSSMTGKIKLLGMLSRYTDRLTIIVLTVTRTCNEI